MGITLQTDRKITQLVQNVEDVFASIENYYHVPHKERNSSAGLRINFGRNPIKENGIEYSPYGSSPNSSLRIGEVSDNLVERVTGKSSMVIGREIEGIRGSSGNEAAKAYERELEAKFQSFFWLSEIALDVNTYHSTKVSLAIDISTLNNDILDAVSEVLKHSGMTPKAQSTRQYEL